MEHSFPCGDLSLDFVGTLRARRNELPTEMLSSAGSLDSWFREAGVVDVDAGCQPSDVDRAIALREAIYSLVCTTMAQGSYDGGALSFVNSVASTPSVAPQLSQNGRLLAATAEQAMSSVARNAIDILGGPDASLLKECARPECTQLYLDRSRGLRREWCAMDSCGNKMKAAAYRARKREERPRPVAA